MFKFILTITVRSLHVYKDISKEAKKGKKIPWTYTGIRKNKKSFIPGACENGDHVVLLRGRSRASPQVWCGQTQAPSARTTERRQGKLAPCSAMLTQACSSRMGELSGQSAPIRVGMPAGGLLLHRFCSAQAFHSRLCSAPSPRCMLVPPGSFPVSLILMIEE